MRYSITTFITLLLLTVGVQAQVQSPAQFLGYELGDHFTRHSQVRDYFKQVADNSPMVTYHEYGKTNERRELVYVVVTSERNQAAIEEIRTNNLKLAGLESGTPTANKKPIVWLSYNVHGNETSSSEAAMNTIYKLITEHQNWLDDVVVIIDPMQNPDGRDRYVNWNNSMTGRNFNALAEAREHQEPWPGGRTNHYYFDLNRDWLWQTQKESKARIQAYQQWMPQVHVDLHEMGYNSPYFFPPAVEPRNDAITRWQRDFERTLGLNNARHFNQNGWLYYTNESFDLFYPSYGDTWPTFNGAIGMTYEQGGGGGAGLGIQTALGDTLSLLDRLTHHSQSSLATVETVYMNKEKVLDEFAKYFDEARKNGSGEYKTFVVKKSNNPDKITDFLKHMDAQQIKYGVARSAVRANGYDYKTGKTGNVSVEKGDYVISTFQTQGTLARVLLEPNPHLTDSITYDQTAWENFYVYGLDGFALKQQVAQDEAPAQVVGQAAAVSGRPYAYLAGWKSPEDLKFLTRLINKGVKVRYSTEDFTVNGQKYDAGTLIIARRGNENLSNFDELVKSTAAGLNRSLSTTETGFVDSGKDFGSSSMSYIKAPKVALVAGEGTRSDLVGHLWHYFDYQIEYPVTMLNADRVNGRTLADYDVLILPSGSYDSILNGPRMEELKAWVRAGGTLIALETANNFLASKEGFSLKVKENAGDEDDSPESRLRTFGDARRDFIPNIASGSIYQIDLDNTHPLAFGYDKQYMSFRMGATAFEYLENGWNVGAAKTNSLRSGFVGHKVIQNVENSLSYGVQNMGAGKVVYMIDNPIFRGFWYNGKLLFGNAVFLVSNQAGGRF